MQDLPNRDAFLQFGLLGVAGVPQFEKSPFALALNRQLFTQGNIDFDGLMPVEICAHDYA
jgi:hypothetical protein